MDYEKAYKEAIDRMKSWANGEHPECFGEAQKAAEFVFPELKEPEDEKIRKELIKYLKERSHSGFNREVRICNDGIAWLENQGELIKEYEDKLDRVSCESFDKGYKAAFEKQGEKNLDDNVKLKFKVGDWVVKGDVVAQNLDNQQHAFVGLDTKGNDFVCKYSHADSIHLWTIQDAKDGDVLANKAGAIFISAGISKKRVTFDCYCYISLQNEFCIEEHKTGSWFYRDGIKPATQKQRHLLFSKMKEAGYEWDAEKKELRKIDKKPAWSEEDEIFFNTALWHISYSISNGESTDIHCSTTDWLKSIRERMKGE